MINLEKYRKEIEKEITQLPMENCNKLLNLNGDKCNSAGTCDNCMHNFVNWLLEEAKVDWSQVKPGTSCLVKDYEHCVWETAVFVTFTLGKPWFMYKDDLRTLGGVLNNANSSTPLVTYNYCKLEKDED